MVPYAPQTAFRPPAPSPAFGSESRFLGQVPLIPRFQGPPLGGVSLPSEHFVLLGRDEKSLGQTFDEILHWNPAFGDLLRLTFHAGTGYLGTYVGMKERGFISTLAWILGVGNGLAAIADAISLIKRAAGTHPPEKKSP